MDMIAETIAAGAMRELSTAEMLDTRPAPRDYVFSRLALAAGTVGLLAAPGDSGKTYVSLQLAATIACAGTGYDPLDLRPTRAGDIYYVTGEDGDDEIHHRIHRIGDAAGSAGRRAMAANLHVWSTFGLCAALAKGGVTSAVAKIAAGARLIVFDTLTRFHAADENDNAAMAAVLSRFEALAQTTGAGVLLLHHTSKSAMQDERIASTHSQRGASVLRDHPRWGGVITPTDDPSVRALVETKHNYGRGHEPIYFRWSAGQDEGPFVTCPPPAAHPPRKAPHPPRHNKEHRHGLY